MKLIKITQNVLNQIQYLPFNRKYKVREDLIKNMNLYGFAVPVILVETKVFGKRQLFIVDGQHRLATAQYLGIEAWAIIVSFEPNTKEEAVKFVASLNSAQKNWTIDHYVHVYAFLGFKDYEILAGMSQDYPYGTSVLSALLYGYRRKAWCTDKLKEGSFVIRQFDSTMKTLEAAADLSKIEKLTARMLLGFHYVRSLEGFDYKKFKERYKKEAKCVKEMLLDDYTDVFSSWV